MAEGRLEAAAEANPLDPKPPYQRSLAERSDLSVAMLEDAIRRRPRYSASHARLAEVLESLANRTASTSLEVAAAASLRQDAEQRARRAVQLYPTSARNRYLLGRILVENGRERDAAAEFREALRLSDRATRVPRLALNGLQKAVATWMTGGTKEEAIRLYRAGKKARLDELAPLEKAIVDAASDSK
jgi:tetratricopeptide (TPR) repeat protein